MLTWKNLIALGYKPDKWFKEALEYLSKNPLSGKELTEYLDGLVPQYIEPREEALEYHLNVETITDIEKENVESARRSMNSIMKTPTIIAGALMPDTCPTGELSIPVGWIAIAKNAIHPAFHSADICCSVMMTELWDLDPKEVLDVAHSTTHFGPGWRKEFSELPRDLTGAILANPFLGEEALDIAKYHLGTQGDGNHFLFVGNSQENGRTFLVTHHGSRGFGAYLYKKGMKLAEYYRRELSPNTLKNNAWIPYDTQDGKDYWEALQIVRQWTKLNHQVLHDTIAEKLNYRTRFSIWNEHNFVFKEDDLFYHAKGATPLKDNFVPDNNSWLRLIPLNMSQPVLVVQGETTENNLGFAPHGAGRNLSRAAHIRSKGEKTIEEIFKEETEGLDIRFFSGITDISELPSAYKDANEVRRQIDHFSLGEVVDEIIPYGCIMAGDWQQEAPWKKKKNNS